MSEITKITLPGLLTRLPSKPIHRLTEAERSEARLDLTYALNSLGYAVYTVDVLPTAIAEKVSAVNLAIEAEGITPLSINSVRPALDLMRRREKAGKQKDKQAC